MPLFNRFRGAFSGIQTDQADVDPHAWTLPSSYSTPKPGDKPTVIPNPRLFANAFIPSETNVENALTCPDISHAAVHLALLECFRNLRLSASTLDVELNQPPAYSEKPSDTPSAETTQLPESQKWDLLVKLAVSRFSVWWTNIDHVLTHATAYRHAGGDKVMVQLTKEYLPPLDVLLVWYTLMLDSDAYFAACQNHERQILRLEHLCFPWPAIRDVIDMERFRFDLPRTAQNIFSTLSGQSSDILTYLKSPPAYTEDGTVPFEIDLFAEVKNQDQFIDEAHKLLWIRSPAVAGSLMRAAVDYSNLRRGTTPIGMDRGQVPFGIKLFRRTHRLFPTHYQLFLQQNRSQGQSSDSKAPIVPGPSSSSDPNAISGRCQCWTCELIRNFNPAFSHTQTSPTASSSSSSSPSASAHQQLIALSSEQLRQIQDDLGFYHAVEQARQRGDTLPTRPPTAAEKEAEATAKAKQKELGYRPGLDEYLEILPDGTRRVRRQNMNPWGRWVGV
ncbi:hypothetical protein FDECE_4588 [Fusarium decemcellulare]|nr:hypothetical protein FDECE_4588 [Fusarium decemcellulare]